MYSTFGLKTETVWDKRDRQRRMEEDNREAGDCVIADHVFGQKDFTCFSPDGGQLFDNCLKPWTQTVASDSCQRDQTDETGASWWSSGLSNWTPVTLLLLQ